MDEFNLEPAQPEDVQIELSDQRTAQLQRALIPGLIMLLLLVIVGVYLLFFSTTEKLTAQLIDFNIMRTPATAVISVINKMDDQAVINRIYPIYFGRENAGSYTKPINAAIEGVSLPLVLNPNEVRVLKLTFRVEKKDLDLYCDPLKDSTYAIISRGEPLQGQLEGNLGIGWEVHDPDGNAFTNNARLFYYILTPTPAGFKDPTSLTRSGILSTDPFELCTQEVLQESN
jgi:hypothetical protein